MKTAVLLPAYKRPEYTAKCVEAINASKPAGTAYFFVYNEDGTEATEKALISLLRPRLYKKTDGIGLRGVILDFFNAVDSYEREMGFKFDFLSKIDNDCLVPPDWLQQILSIFELHPELEICSPNVHPSNAAFKYGRAKEGKAYRVADIVGGVWTMRRDLIEDVMFENYPGDGIGGAISILRQIRIEKRPVMGWLPDVIYQDIGHWSGQHPEHIKSTEHFFYSHEVGRPVAWTPSENQKN